MSKSAAAVSLQPGEHASPRRIVGDRISQRLYASAPNSPAVEAAAARGIHVEPMESPDAWGNTWQAVIPRRGRGTLQPLAALLAVTPDEAARAALQYVGAKGWKS